MLTRIRIVALCMGALMILSGCAGGAFGGIGSVTEAIDSTTVVREVQHYDRGDRGDLLTISLTVPDAWVDNVETVNNGSVITFNLVEEGEFPKTIFTLHTLSRSQYWEQSSSYPGDYRVLTSSGDTYFVYHVPTEGLVDAYSAITAINEDAPNDAPNAIDNIYDANMALILSILETFEIQVSEDMM